MWPSCDWPILTTPQCGLGAVWSLKLTHIRYEEEDEGIDSGGGMNKSPASLLTSGTCHLPPSSITVHWPLLLEDPFLEERKSRLMEGVMQLGGPSESSSLDTSKGTGVWNRGGRQVIDTLFWNQPELLNNVHKREWEEAERKGVRFNALVLPEVRLEEG